MNDTSLEVPFEKEREHRTWWWKEVLIVASFYFLYSLTRNRFGSIHIRGDDQPVHAFSNAVKIIQLERALGLFHEETIQQWFLPYTWFIQFMNTYYGTAHFFVTIGVFIILYRRRKGVFSLYRNVLAATTGLAIIGFALFPLMPPRLLDAPCPKDGVGFGGACLISEVRTFNGAQNFGFSDTLKEFGGPWNFESGGIAKTSNQYAAMPSLHIAWASWCAFGMWPLVRKRIWIRALVLLYPALTLLGVVVTANHFWIDGVGGLIALGAGFVLGGSVYHFNERRLNAQFEHYKAHHPAHSQR